MALARLSNSLTTRMETKCLTDMITAWWIISFVSIVQVAALIPDYEGNVHLVFDGSNEFEGVLQVYTQGKWNTVCYSLNGSTVTNEEAAAAACRQRGYDSFRKFDSASKLGYDLPENTQPTAVRDIRCPEVKNALTETEIFLLRCDYAMELIPTEECDEIVGIQCGIPDSNPYSGQIRRSSDNHRTVLLEIYLEDEWRPVCTSQLSSISADSACRQLGFTHSSQRPIPSNDQNLQGSWKINDLSECDQENVSFSCFTHCIAQSAGYEDVNHCDENQYGIFCQFNKSIDGILSSGNQFICPYPSDIGSADTCIGPGFIGAAVGFVVGGIIVITVITPTLLLWLCCCHLRIDHRNANQPFRLYKIWRQFCCCGGPAIDPRLLQPLNNEQPAEE